MASPSDADEPNPPLKREREGDEDMDGLGDASGEGRYSNRSKYKCGLCGQPKKGHVCPAQKVQAHNNDGGANWQSAKGGNDSSNSRAMLANKLREKMGARSGAGEGAQQQGDSDDAMVLSDTTNTPNDDQPASSPEVKQVIDPKPAAAQAAGRAGFTKAGAEERYAAAFPDPAPRSNSTVATTSSSVDTPGVMGHPTHQEYVYPPPSPGFILPHHSQSNTPSFHNNMTPLGLNLFPPSSPSSVQWTSTPSSYTPVLHNPLTPVTASNPPVMWAQNNVSNVALSPSTSFFASTPGGLQGLWQ